ncbi:MAG: hypothetical protein ACQERF_11870 [Actinomycetota bacterium]
MTSRFSCSSPRIRLVIVIDLCDLDEWGGADAAALATIYADYLKELEGTP